MLKRCVALSRTGFAAIVAGVALASATFLASPVEARSRHRHHAVARYTPAFAAMVVDANSGRMLFGRNENELRHPASITKVMTLYLLFEALEKGRFRLDSEIKISARAHRQAPSKLGLDIGDTIAVEDAIKAIVTKSANDIAVAVAEAVGGSEDDFAVQMTRKAHALGMAKTVYVNASGLPDSDQVTTARDLTLLGRSIQERFPKYYQYFSTHNFNYAGANMRNHNHLLGRVEGMDGIKTGYTRASGFNLLTSVKRGGHRIVSVVLGGASGRSRDNIMAGLIEEHIESGANTRTAALIDHSAADRESDVADASPARTPVPVERVRIEEPARPAPAKNPLPPVAAGAPLQLAAVNPQIERQVERIRPAFVSGAPRPDAPLPPVSASDKGKRVVLDGSTSVRPVLIAGKPAIAAATTPSALGWVAGPSGRPATLVSADRAIESAATVSALPVARPAAARTATKSEPAKTVTVVAKNDAPQRPAVATTGWMIQIGATDDATKATDLLTRAKLQGKGALASARPFTEKVQKGDTTLYRARFAGLENDTAEAACKSLKKSGFACFTTKN